MPIYEFICNKCFLKFEKIYSKYSDNKKEICPNCESESDRVISLCNHRLVESKTIPKEIDKKIGYDSEKRWLEYEDKKKIKDKIRRDAGSEKLSRDPDGNYVPFTMKNGDQVVSADEGVKLRKEMIKEFSDVIHDPKSRKFQIDD